VKGICPGTSLTHLIAQARLFKLSLPNPFPRPHRPLYVGSPAILAGVSFGLDKPATLAIVDITTGRAITYRSLRQLLGEDHHLLNRQRQRQHQKAKQRRHNQLKFAPNR